MSVVSFRQDIQGLRAIAVLAVMVFHFNPAWLPGGFAGVDVFLVVSGFLITSILLKKKAQADYSLASTLKYFYTSRIKRIAPAYFVMLLVASLLSAVLFLPQDFNIFNQGLEKAAWFNSNSYFAGYGDYFAPASHEQPLLHTWSLAIEIQFYLLAPFLILLLPTRLLAIVLSVLLVGLTLTAEYRLRILGAEQSTYYSLYARLPEFFAGALAALYNNFGLSFTRGNMAATVGLLLILLAISIQPYLGPFPGLGALLPALGAILVLLQTKQNKASTFLSRPALVWIGTLSYSLYLWHWPVLAFLRYYTGSQELDLIHSLVFIGLTMALSVISYYLIEERLRGGQRGVGYATIFIAVFGVSFSIKKINEYLSPDNLSVEYNRYADPATICHGKILGDCLRGNVNSTREVLVLGDSHAAMLNHLFDFLGKELDFKARIITSSSCITITGFDYTHLPERAHLACLNQIEKAKLFFEKAEFIFIAGAWDYQNKNEAFKPVLKTFLAQHGSKKIYIMSQVPRFVRDAKRVERFTSIGLPAQLKRNPDYQVANTELADLVSTYPNAWFLALDSLPIFSAAPFYQGELIYRDEHHLNEVGARFYAATAKQTFSMLLGEVAR